MKKEGKQTKVGFIFVCPHCGSTDFQAKEGFSLLGQKFQCNKCKGTFKDSLKEKAKRSAFSKTTTGTPQHKPRIRRR